MKKIGLYYRECKTHHGLLSEFSYMGDSNLFADWHSAILIIKQRVCYTIRMEIYIIACSIIDERHEDKCAYVLL